MRYARIDWSDPENPRVKTFRDYAREPVGIKLENGYPVLVPSTVAEPPAYDPATQIRTRTETISAEGHEVAHAVRELTAEELEARRENERVAIEQQLPADAIKRMIRGSVDPEALDPEEAVELVTAFPQWRPDVAYPSGEILGYGPDKLLRVIQEHTSQADWLPENTPGLYQILTPDSGGEYPDWQDWGGNSENLYHTGDRVTHNGKNWQSKIDNNAYEPLPENWAAWEELTE